jgi:hypothetical protein
VAGGFRPDIHRAGVGALTMPFEHALVAAGKILWMSGSGMAAIYVLVRAALSLRGAMRRAPEAQAPQQATGALGDQEQEMEDRAHHA